MRADPHEADGQWPERVLALCRELRRTTGERERQRIVGSLWLIANAAVARYVRFHVHSSRMDSEDVSDIASEKSFAFIQHIGDPIWVAEGTHPGQVCSYFSTLARNGVADHFRRQKRWTRTEELDTASRPSSAPSAQADERLLRRQFVEAMLDCMKKLTPRARAVWFLRVMLDMSAKEIARHPAVGMNPAAVDMMLSRTRTALRECAERRGLDPRDIPPGTLAMLWHGIREDLDSTPGNDASD